MGSGNAKASDPHRILLYLLDKVKLERSNEYVVLSNLSFYYTLKNLKKSCKCNNFKISAPTWNEELFSVSDIQDCFEYIIKSMKNWRVILQ